MENPSLPTNPDDWPNDPWRLLGVARDAEREQIRKAYARMLRQYRPEHHPTAFQKIRAAYEMALRFVGHVQSSDEAIDNDAEPNAAEPDSCERAKPETADRELAAAAERAQQSVAAERDALWNQAVAGDGRLAAAGLAALHEKHPRDEEIVLRLYWVHKLFPGDAASAAQVLAKFIASGMWSADRVGALYRRELATSAAEALSEHCRTTIAANLSAALYRGIIASRWQAATATGRLSAIGRDLTAWRKIASFDDGETWNAILFLALGHLRWGTHPKCEACFERVRREVYRLTNGDLQHSHALDELDFMERVWQGWNGLRFAKTSAKSWAPLIVASWCGSSDLLRRKIGPLLSEAGRTPIPTLMRVDKLASGSSAAVGQIQRGLDRFRYELAAELEIPYAWNHRPTKQLALDFMHASHSSTYGQVRRRMLEFCMEFAMPPALLGRLAAEAWPKDPTGAAVLADTIEKDAPLQVVWLAHRLYWR